MVVKNYEKVFKALGGKAKTEAMIKKLATIDMSDP